jgi:hypothetical protein
MRGTSARKQRSYSPNVKSKDEVFLKTINSILSTGEVPGLFAKDER